METGHQAQDEVNQNYKDLDFTGDMRGECSGVWVSCYCVDMNMSVQSSLQFLLVFKCYTTAVCTGTINDLTSWLYTWNAT